jgi:hypothetical protein
MVRPVGRFLRHPEVFVQFLARPHAADADLHVGTGTPARQPDHLVREVQDPDGAPHLQHEQLAPAAHRRGLQDQLHRFRNRHEVPGHPGVRDDDGTTRLDLLEESRDHAPPRAEDVAEAHPAPGSTAAACAGEHQLLGDALRRAHDAGRTHGLVGGDEHEMGDPDLFGGPDEIPRAHDVGHHRFARGGLEHGDVFVGGGVEEHVGLVPMEHSTQSVRVPDVDQLRHPLNGQRGQDVVQMCLVMIEQHQALRATPGDLAADLRADGATGARDDDAAALKERSDPRKVGVHRLAPQQVVDPQVPQVLQAQFRAHQLVRGRQDAQRDPGVLGHRRDARHRRRRAVRVGDHDLVDVQFGQQAG